MRPLNSSLKHSRRVDHGERVVAVELQPQHFCLAARVCAVVHTMTSIKTSQNHIKKRWHHDTLLKYEMRGQVIQGFLEVEPCIVQNVLALRHLELFTLYIHLVGLPQVASQAST